MLVTYIENFNSNKNVKNNKIEDKLINYSIKTLNLYYARNLNTLLNISINAQK